MFARDLHHQLGHSRVEPFFVIEMQTPAANVLPGQPLINVTRDLGNYRLFLCIQCVQCLCANSVRHLCKCVNIAAVQEKIIQAFSGTVSITTITFQGSKTLALP